MNGRAGKQIVCAAVFVESNEISIVTRIYIMIGFRDRMRGTVMAVVRLDDMNK